MTIRPLSFRVGNTLATTFTGTLTERYGNPVERIGTTERLMTWFELNGLAVDSCTSAQLEEARELRESIHALATAVASSSALPPSDLVIVNAASGDGRFTAYLTPSGERRWLLGSASAKDALGVVAADAIALLSGDRDGRVAICASETCRAVFLDTSQSHTRRWCDMNTCGNRQKKARLKQNRPDDATVN